jgi:hypothetical protein
LLRSAVQELAAIPALLSKYYWSGIPSNAWYLATFGGTNDFTGIRVQDADKLGMPAAEQLWAATVTAVPPLSAGDAYHDFALALYYQAGLNHEALTPTTQESAIACAFLAVGVFTPFNVIEKGVTDCGCPGGEVGMYCGKADSAFPWDNAVYSCDANGRLVDAQHCPGAGTCKVNGGGKDACTADILEPNSGCKVVYQANPKIPCDADEILCPNTPTSFDLRAQGGLFSYAAPPCNGDFCLTQKEVTVPGFPPSSVPVSCTPVGNACQGLADGSFCTFGFLPIEASSQTGAGQSLLECANGATVGLHVCPLGCIGFDNGQDKCNECGDEFDNHLPDGPSCSPNTPDVLNQCKGGQVVSSKACQSGCAGPNGQVQTGSDYCLECINGDAVACDGENLQVCSGGVTQTPIPCPYGCLLGSSACNLAPVTGPLPNALPLVAQAASTSPQSSLTVLVGAQSAGDTNVVAVSWASSQTAALLASNAVTDSNGNSYQLAAGPTSSANYTQALFVASNIAAATPNTLTVNFQGKVPSPEVRLAEYAHLAALDKTAAATGTGTVAETSIQTSDSPEIVVAAVTSAAGASGPGAQFNARVLSTPNRNLLEDWTTESLPSIFPAEAPLFAASEWVAQAVSFPLANHGSLNSQGGSTIPVQTVADPCNVERMTSQNVLSISACDSNGNLTFCQPVSGVSIQTQTCPNGCVSTGTGQDYCAGSSVCASVAGSDTICDDSGDLIQCAGGKATGLTHCPEGCQNATGGASCTGAPTGCRGLPGGNGAFCTPAGDFEVCAHGFPVSVAPCYNGCVDPGSGQAYCLGGTAFSTGPCATIPMTQAQVDAGMLGGSGTVCDGNGHLLTCVNGGQTASLACSTCQSTTTGEDFCAPSSGPSALCSGLPFQGNGAACDGHGNLVRCFNGYAASAMACPACAAVGGGEDFCPGTTDVCRSIPKGTGTVCDNLFDELITCVNGFQAGSQTCASGCISDQGVPAQNCGGSGCLAANDNGNDRCAPSPASLCRTLPNGSGTICDYNHLLQCSNGEEVGAAPCGSGCQAGPTAGTDYCTPCTMPTGNGSICSSFTGTPFKPGTAVVRGYLVQCQNGVPVPSETQTCGFGCQQTTNATDYCVPSENALCLNLPDESGFVCNGFLQLIECQAGVAVNQIGCLCDPVGNGQDTCFAQGLDGPSPRCAGQPFGQNCINGVLTTCTGDGQFEGFAACVYGCTSHGMGQDVCNGICTGLPNGSECSIHDVTGNTLLNCQNGNLVSSAKCATGCQFGTSPGGDHCATNGASSFQCAEAPGGNGPSCDYLGRNLLQCSGGVPVSSSACGGGCLVANGQPECVPTSAAQSCAAIPNGTGSACDSATGTGNNLQQCVKGKVVATQTCSNGCTAYGAQAECGPCGAAPNGTGTLCSKNPSGTLLTCANGAVTQEVGCPAGICAGAGVGADFCDGPPCNVLPGGTGSACDPTGAYILICQNGLLTSSTPCGTPCQGVSATQATCDSVDFPCKSLPNGSDCVSGTILTCANGVATAEFTCPIGCTSHGAGADICNGPCTGLSDGTHCDPTDPTGKLQTCSNGTVVSTQICSAGCQALGGGKDQCVPTNCQAYQLDCSKGQTCCSGLTCDPGTETCLAASGASCGNGSLKCAWGETCGSNGLCCEGAGADCNSTDPCCPGLTCNLQSHSCQ